MSDSYTVPLLSFTISVSVAIVAFFFISYLPSLMSNTSKLLIGIAAILLLSSLSYGLSIAASVFRQQTMCKKIQIKSILTSNLILLGTVGGACLFLFFENIPILKYLFGEFVPRDPVTGLEYTPDSAQYKIFMESEKHYKIQFFSNIVKAVLPAYLDESVKDGFAYMYWVFWMIMLPLFVLLSAQGAC
jgi:hypothetical protein